MKGNLFNWKHEELPTNSLSKISQLLFNLSKQQTIYPVAEIKLSSKLWKKETISSDLQKQETIFSDLWKQENYLLTYENSSIVLVVVWMSLMPYDILMALDNKG